LLVFIINRIAGHTLCDAEKFGAMTAKQLDAEIARITRWAEENHGKDETAILLGVLENALKSRTRWFRLNHQVARLSELKAKAAVPLLFRFVEEGLADDREIPDIRGWCDNIAPGALQEVARKALEHADEGTRKRIAHLDLDRDAAALLLQDMERDLNSGMHFLWSGNERLVERKVKGAVSLFFRFVEEKGVSGIELNQIARLCEKIDPDTFEKLTQEGLKNKDAKVQMRVALLALNTTKRAEALTVLGNGLENGAVQLAESASTLLYFGPFLRDQNGDCRKTSARVFKNRHLLTMEGNERYTIVSAAVDAGLADGLRLYLRLLETHGNTIEGKTYDRPVAQVAADEIMTGFGPRDHDVAEIQTKTTSQEKISALKTWLKEKIELIEKKK
jgi:hypothetical protein